MKNQKEYLAILEENGLLEDMILKTADLIWRVLTKTGVHSISKAELLERKDIPYIDHRTILFNEDFNCRKDVEAMLVERALYLLLTRKNILQIGRGVYALNRESVFTDENLVKLPIHGKLGLAYKSSPESGFFSKF